MSTPIVTLTTDWGEQDFFAGMVKGMLMSNVDGVRVVDISHRLKAYDVMTASFVVKQACLGFPPGTVHIIDVATQAPYVALRSHGQYFLCSDNGLPSQALGDTVEEAVTLPAKDNAIYTFAAYNLFTPAAIHLLRGGALSDLGPACDNILQRPMPTYMPQGEYYRIFVLYVDSYGNAYLGISFKEFEELRAGRNFTMQVREMEVSELTTSYYRQAPTADPKKMMLLTVSSTGQMELAMREGSLAQLAGLKAGASVLLRFK
ncbi:MAG: SAM-dependent chlorinase/fluorinase [Bacteroidales bacterium]|nr:SAM-dependent chlorinase/fluorinase [Bacteroidales bacterium]